MPTLSVFKGDAVLRPTEQPDRLSALLQQRDELHAEFSKLSAIATPEAELDAVAAVQVRWNKITAELRHLATQIYAVKLENVLADVQEIENLLHDAIRVEKEQLMRLRTLLVVLVDEKSAALTRGDEASAAAIQSLMVRVENLKRPAIEQNQGSFLVAVAAWREALR
jgi:hypothetical protein